MDIKIIRSDAKTEEAIIYDLMAIESDVYSPEYCGQYESIVRRFQKYKEMFLLAYDKDRNQAIGYLCYFPISERLHEELLSHEAFHDDDIVPEDVVDLTECNYIYLLSIAIYKDYHGKGIGKALMSSFLEQMKIEQGRGHAIQDIITSVVTKQGERMAEEFGFQMLKDCMETEKYKLYRKDGKEIC